MNSNSIIMVLGIFTGSMCWWLILGSIIASIKHKLPQHWINGIKYLSAFILACFGLATIFLFS